MPREYSFTHTLDLQGVVLSYPGEVRPFRNPPPNHAVPILVATPFIGTIRMAVIDVRSFPAAGHGPCHSLPVLKPTSVVYCDRLEYPLKAL